MDVHWESKPGLCETSIRNENRHKIGGVFIHRLVKLVDKSLVRPVLPCLDQCCVGKAGPVWNHLQPGLVVIYNAVGASIYSV